MQTAGPDTAQGLHRSFAAGREGAPAESTRALPDREYESTLPAGGIALAMCCCPVDHRNPSLSLVLMTVLQDWLHF